jgi:protein-tyrosine-phosphatase
MAEGILATRLPEKLKPYVSVHSAGTQALHGNRAEPYAVQAAAKYGADISGHRARLLDPKMVRASDLVLAMEPYHLTLVNQLFLFRCKYAKLLGSFNEQRPYPEIEDPYRLPLDAYETCAAEIVDCMPGVIADIETAMARKTV